jgi:UDP-N-acetylmuramoyl-tripeptide--D-alanyl-D-alanine ligase
MEVDLSHGKTMATFSIGLGHEAYPSNLAAAAAFAAAAGLPLEEIKDGLRSFVGLSGRYILKGSNGQIVVDDCYNAAPSSVRAGLASINSGFPNESKVLILGDMLELGDETESAHLSLGPSIAAIKSLALLVTVGESGRIFGNGAIAAGVNPTAVRSFRTVDELIAYKSDILGHGGLIYVKGSNGVGLKKFVDAIN